MLAGKHFPGNLSIAHEEELVQEAFTVQPIFAQPAKKLKIHKKCGFSGLLAHRRTDVLLHELVRFLLESPLHKQPFCIGVAHHAIDRRKRRMRPAGH